MLQLFAFFLPAVPLLLLLGFLMLGRYPGCEAIVRLSERIASRRRHRGGDLAPVRAPPLRAADVGAAGGGLLLALATLRARTPPAQPKCLPPLAAGA